MSHCYPSDISRKQFFKIQSILESSKKRTRPRTIDLYDVFCGVLYVLKSGCQWRMLPKDYPDWELCYYYFSVWRKKKDKKSDSTIEEVFKKISQRSAYFRWSEGENQFSYYRCPECQKLRYGKAKRI